MPRILGVDIPLKKRLVISLTYIYGVGLTRSAQIMDALHFDKNVRASDLTEEQVALLNKYLIDPKNGQLYEGDLRRQVASNIKRLQGIGCYRGLRHRTGLPVRGQRTRTNARTRKGPRRTVANKKI